jgi:O-succinylbenzoic acid--CoA ligase
MTRLRDLADTHTERPALQTPSVRLTYGQLYHRASACAALLAARYGIGPGNRVCTIAGNSAEHVQFLHALFLLGAVACPLNRRLGAVELGAQADQLRPALIVSDRDHSLPGRTGVVSLLALFREAESIGGVEAAYADDDDTSLCSVLFTSGTSGKAHAVPHRWSHHRASAEANAAHLGVREHDNWLCVLPLYHVGGLAILLRSLFYGTAMSMLDGFDEDIVCSRLRDGDITLLSLVPTMLYRMLRHGTCAAAGAFSSLRAVLLGGGPAGADLVERAVHMELPVLPTYGLTESGSQIVTMPPGEAAQRPLSAGKALRGVRVIIRDDHGAACPPDITGEICIAGGMVVDGYDDGSEKARFAEGFFRTGDLGYVDGDGYLYVQMRRDDRIVTGGENVSPHEVEAVLLAHPAVLEAAVFGIADEEWGQRVCAVVVLRDEADEEDLERHCRLRLAAYKVPRRWEVLDALPRTSSGKVRRGELRERFGC